MGKKAFDKIAEGLNEVLAIARGEAKPAKLFDAAEYLKSEEDVAAVIEAAVLTRDTDTIIRAVRIGARVLGSELARVAADRIEELEAALRPFAGLMLAPNPTTEGDRTGYVLMSTDGAEYDLVGGDIVRARAALAAKLATDG